MAAMASLARTGQRLESRKVQPCMRAAVVVRADYYAGSGAEAGEWAGRLKQPLRLWVLWPR